MSQKESLTDELMDREPILPIRCLDFEAKIQGQNHINRRGKVHDFFPDILRQHHKTFSSNGTISKWFLTDDLGGTNPANVDTWLQVSY